MSTQEATMDKLQPIRTLKKHEILEQWDQHLRVNLHTCQIRPDLLEIRTTRGTLLGTYVRVPKIGWIEAL
jgi:hypothetical protein